MSSFILNTCGISFVDSTCIPVVHNKRQFSMKVFKDSATKGKITMCWYVGFKFHLLCNENGEIVNFVLTQANVDDRNESVLSTLTDKIMLRKGSIIESVNDMLKSVAQLVHTRHRSVHNFIKNLLAALGAYCFFAVKPHVNSDFEVAPSNGQLVLLQ